MSVVNPSRRNVATINAFSVPLQTAGAKTWMTAAMQLVMVKLNVATTSAPPVNELVINASETLTVAVLHLLGALLNAMLPATRNAAIVCRTRTLVRQTRTVAPTIVTLEPALARQVVKTEIVPTAEKMTGAARADARETDLADARETDLADERIRGIAPVALHHSSY
jgi:hypothetical protein